MIKVYLGGPIGTMSVAEANAWRTKAANQLELGGIETINPLRGECDSKRPNYNCNEIVMRDKLDIRSCDVVLVYWPERTVSNGTAMEIMYAWENDKYLVFVGEWAEKDYWIKYHATKVFSDLESAVEHIKERMMV